ncbi:branched-chain amino acid ABC transporter permease [Herminiimonas sp. CN]|uniref:branched-chain amino acid ABC transporter permease n=1 Tax=Herminiimonas sp. CN TaxID=1349818 RepID=UPI000A53AD66|nr:branched-chain amino acid ABC transporter permease [Herminiimonas sp. CN]
MQTSSKTTATAMPLILSAPRRGRLSARALPLLLALGVLGLGLVPLIGSPFYLQLFSKIMIMAIFALSLDLLVGYTGLVSLGHSAYFGLAGYAVALLSPQYEAASLLTTLPLAMLASGLLALVIGLLVLRTSGIYFIMVTLAFAQMLYFLFHDTKLGGGSDGLYLYVKPELRLGATQLLSLDDPAQFYYFIFGLMLAVYFILRMVLRSPFGHALLGIKANEHRMRSLGFHVFWYKLGAFVLAGMLAGLSGYLAACQFGFVSPEILSWHHSGNVLMMLLLGGMGSLYGAVIGAFSFVLLQEFFSSEVLFGSWARHWQLAMGTFIVLMVLLLPNGLAGLLRRFGRTAIGKEQQ